MYRPSPIEAKISCSVGELEGCSDDSSGGDITSAKADELELFLKARSGSWRISPGVVEYPDGSVKLSTGDEGVTPPSSNSLVPRHRRPRLKRSNGPRAADEGRMVPEMF